MSKAINIKTTEISQTTIMIPDTVYVSNIVIAHKTYHYDGIKYIDTTATVYPGLPVDTNNMMHPKIEYIPLSYIGL